MSWSSGVHAKCLRTKLLYTKGMRNKRVVILLVVILILTIVFVITALVVADRNKEEGTQVLVGRVTHISNECWVDGICSITLDNSESIITGCGLMRDGNTCAVYDQSKLHIGQKVKAIVTKSELDQDQYGLDCYTCTIRIVSK